MEKHLEAKHHIKKCWYKLYIKGSVLSPFELLRTKIAHTKLQIHLLKGDHLGSYGLIVT